MSGVCGVVSVPALVAMVPCRCIPMVCVRLYGMHKPVYRRARALPGSSLQRVTLSLGLKNSKGRLRIDFVPAAHRAGWPALFR